MIGPGTALDTPAVNRIVLWSSIGDFVGLIVLTRLGSTLLGGDIGGEETASPIVGVIAIELVASSAQIISLLVHLALAEVDAEIESTGDVLASLWNRLERD